MALRIKDFSIRLGTAAEQAAGADLADGQFGYATDTNELKVGTGALDWTLLPLCNITAEALYDTVADFFVNGDQTEITTTKDDTDNTIDLAVV